MKTPTRLIHDMIGKNKIQYCKKCNEPIGVGMNEVLSGYDTTQLKRQSHIVKLHRDTGLCDDCYNQGEK